MLYLFHGSDTEKVRVKAFAWVAAAKLKEPQLVYTRLSREELSVEVLDDVARSGGLFVQRRLIVLDDPFPTSRVTSDDADADSDAVHESTDSMFIDAALDTLAQSENVVLILAPKLSAARVKKVSALAKQVYVIDQKAARADARGFNSALVNALGARRRDALWLELNRAFRAGDAPEMLHGLLHWKARDLMSKGSRVWTEREARALSLTLIELLQSSRRGGLELRAALERFVLSL